MIYAVYKHNTKSICNYPSPSSMLVAIYKDKELADFYLLENDINGCVVQLMSDI